MVAITSINSATPSIQASLGRARLAQARREAEQAEAEAKDLRAQADQAEQEAAESKDRVRGLASAQSREGATYAPPASSTRRTVGEVVRVQGDATEQANRPDDSAKRTPSANPTPNPLGIYTSAASTAGTPGKATGRIVNVSA